MAIAPLTDTPYNHSRWQGHWLEHGVFGTPIVVPDLPPYTGFKDGETIIKVRTEAEWRDALLSLVEDAHLRERIGQAARAEMLEHYTTDTMGPRWRDWYEGVGR